MRACPCKGVAAPKLFSGHEKGYVIRVGHGTGTSNAAHHLRDYLRTHHPAIAQRISREFVADLSSVTEPQLLELANSAWKSRAKPGYFKRGFTLSGEMRVESTRRLIVSTHSGTV